MKKRKKNQGVPLRKNVGSRAARVPSPKKATPSGRSARSRARAQRPPRVMDIHARPGTKVAPIYKYGRPLNGYTYDQEMVAKYLHEGHVFTVERTVAHNFSTDVYLKEVPGVAFNSVCLADAPALVSEAARSGPRSPSRARRPNEVSRATNGRSKAKKS